MQQSTKQKALSASFLKEPFIYIAVQRGKKRNRAHGIFLSIQFPSSRFLSRHISQKSNYFYIFTHKMRMLREGYLKQKWCKYMCEGIISIVNQIQISSSLHLNTVIQVIPLVKSIRTFDFLFLWKEPPMGKSLSHSQKTFFFYSWAKYTATTIHHQLLQRRFSLQVHLWQACYVGQTQISPAFFTPNGCRNSPPQGAWFFLSFFVSKLQKYGCSFRVPESGNPHP